MIDLEVRRRPGAPGRWRSRPLQGAGPDFGSNLTDLCKSGVTFDTTGDPYELARFWAMVVGRPMRAEDEPGDPEVSLIAEGQPTMLFVRVPEGKVVKNRVHLDLQPQDRTRDEDVDRLIGAGAKLFEDHRRPDGTGWVTLLDPEGNEFCVERSAAERAAA